MQLRNIYNKVWTLCIPSRSSPFVFSFYTVPSISIWIVRVFVCRCKVNFSLLPSLEYSASILFNLELSYKKSHNLIRIYNQIRVRKANKMLFQENELQMFSINRNHHIHEKQIKWTKDATSNPNNQQNI